MPNRDHENEVEPVKPGSEPEEPVPDEIVEAARSAFGQRSPGDLAVLAHDSLVEAGAPPEDHVLRFEHERLAFTVHVSAGPTEVSLSGSVSPALPGRLELVTEGSDLRFVSDTADGTFSFGPVGHGLVRLTFVPAGASPVYTDWFRI